MDDRSNTSAPPSYATSRAAAIRRSQWLLGLGATLIVLALQATGLLDQTFAELATLDVRAQRFGRNNPPPSDRIAIVAIDDQAINSIGRWPWHRERLAQAVDELRLAGADVIALDLLLTEPQEERYRRVTGGPDLHPVRDDDLLAAALAAHGRVVLAANFSLGTAGAAHAESAGRVAVEAVIRDRPEILAFPDEQAVDALESVLAPNVSAVGRADRRAALLAAFRAVRTAHLHEAASSSSVPAATLMWPRSEHPELPIAGIADHAARLANVTLNTLDRDGKLRRIPLVVEHGGRLWPLLGVAAVALHRGVSAGEIAVDPASLTISTPDGPLGIALQRVRIRGRATDGLFFLTWPKAAPGWLAQFPPAGADLATTADGTPASAVSIRAVLNPVLIGERIAHNATALHDATRRALAAQLLTLDGYDAAAAPLFDLPPHHPDWPARFRAAEPFWRAAAADAAGFLEMVGDQPPSDDDERAMIDLLREIATRFPVALDEITSGLADIAQKRRRTAALLGGRICFVGFTATAAITDVVGTSIDPRTPGVVVHAAVASSILTGVQRTPAPLWVNLAAVAALGLLGTFVGVRGTVLTGPIFVVLLVVLWFLVTAVVFWDAGRTIVAFTGPSLAAGSGWLGVMLHRLLVEQRARRRTEERFRSYVSPAVVDILVNNPQLDSMVPQKRELTVMFTDLAGFTTIAERLGSIRTARLLATYLGAMTDILQSTGATLDKYLGDGIMAFWGAPIADPDHAASACRTVLRMVRTLDQMNELGAFGEAGRLEMRAGLAAGELMVGDFGNPPRNSSYTVIGDAANLAARLESACKQFGVRILISQRVRDLAGPEFLCRPIGRIAVKGKQEAEMLYELIGDLQPRGDRTADWVELTRRSVEAYLRADFAEALAGFDRLESEYADVLLARIYRRSIESWLAAADKSQTGRAPAGFDGTISLSEK